MKVSIRRTTGVAAALVIAASGLLAPTMASAADPLPTPVIAQLGYYDSGSGPNDALVDIYWSSPGSTHDATKILVGYEAALKTGVSLATTVQTLTIDNPGASMAVFEDLTYGQTYDVGLRALYTVDGLPESSAWVYADGDEEDGGGPVTPLHHAPPVQNLTVKSNSSGTLTARWTIPAVPAHTEQPFFFSLVASPEPDYTSMFPQIDLAATACYGTCTSATFKNLRNGVAYDVSVSTNGGPYSLGGSYDDDAWATGTPYGAPVKPSALTASLKGSTAKLKWKLSKSTTAGPVSGYKVYVNGKLKKTLAKTATSYSATKIKKGKTYTFTVKAYNAHGASSALTLKKKWKKKK